MKDQWKNELILSEKFENDIKKKRMSFVLRISKDEFQR